MDYHRLIYVVFGTAIQFFGIRPRTIKKEKERNCMLLCHDTGTAGPNESKGKR
jgi:hypothetical protein